VILLRKSVQVFDGEIAKALGDFPAEGRHPFQSRSLGERKPYETDSRTISYWPQ
jgi:hypothetical protein